MIHSARQIANSLPIRDQRGVQSCVAVAFVDAVAITARGGPFSALFTHFEARRRKGHHNHNIGSDPEQVMAAIERHGLCPEPLFPDASADFRTAPPPDAYTAAKDHGPQGFTPVDRDMDSLLDCLATRAAFTACLRLSARAQAAFLTGTTADTGRVPLPHPADGAVFNHAMVCVGYDPGTQCFVMRNSFGETWGDHGHAHVPTAYLTAHPHSYGLWAAL